MDRPYISAPDSSKNAAGTRFLVFTTANRYTRRLYWELPGKDTRVERWMYSLPLRILLAAIAVTYGTYQLANGQQSAMLLLFAAALLIYGYFRYGAVRPAFSAMQRGDLKTARKHIGSIMFPQWLSPQSKAYFHWVNAVLTLEDFGNADSAVEQMQLAIGGKLRTSHDRCVATAMLAHVEAAAGDVQRASALLEQARQIPHRESATVYLDKVRSEFPGEP